MALRGNLKDFSLPDVFQLITFSKKTGVLRIRRSDRAEGSVWFRDGEVFFAQSNWHGELLGQRLVAAQRITQQALTRALQIKESEGPNGRRLGGILVDEGYITDAVLETFVQEQIQDTIFDLMRWDEGEFDFELLPEVVDEDIGLSLSIENIVMEGARRLEEWNRIKKKIPSMDIVFKMATAPGEGTFEISLKPIEWNLLLLVDSTRSVGELAVATGRTDFEVARIVYGLFSAGLLEFATDDEVARMRAERAERESRLVAIEAEQRVREQAQAAVAVDRESALEAEAARTAVPSQAAQPAAAPELAAEADVLVPSVPEATSVPEFLGGATVAPTADDVSVFEEMVGAVLHAPARPAEPVAAPIEPVVAAEPEPLASEFSLAPETPVASPPEIAVEQPIELAPEVDTQAQLEAAEVPQFLETAPAPPSFETTEVTQPAHEPECAHEPPIAEAPSEPAPVEQSFEEPVAEAVAEAVIAEPAVPDFERDLMALGLGEMPPDVTVEPAPAQVPAVSPTPTIDLEPPAEPMSELVGPGEEPSAFNGLGFTLPGTEDRSVAELEALAEGLLEYQPEPAAAPVEEIQTAPDPTPALEMVEEDLAPDFGALMESLDEGIDEEVQAAPVPLDDLEAELSRDATPSGGVISTDVYLADITIDDLGLSGGMNDELSALTGVERKVRPTASVNKLPEPGQPMLHRDSRIDRATLMKIIDGIEKL
jgi:hypothetical protein